MVRFISTVTLLSLLVTAAAFGTPGVSLPSSFVSTVQSTPRLSPLFISGAGTDLTNGEETSPVVRSIEAEMARAQRKREKYEAKLRKFKSKIKELEKKKMKYLEGSTLVQLEQTFTETAARSAIKAMMWRVIAGSVTLVTTLKFSGNFAYALKVVGSDFFSKAFTMFVGERIMNKSSAGRKSGSDSAGRSVAKALIWRLFAICNTLTVCFFISKDFSMASKIAGSDAIFKTFLMVAYERVWAKIEWGKEYQVDFTI